MRDIIDKVIIKERSQVEVWAHVPLYNLKLGHEPQSRNANYTVPYFEHSEKYSPRLYLERSEKYADYL